MSRFNDNLTETFISFFKHSYHILKEMSIFQKVGSELLLDSSSGNIRPTAIKIFTMALQYLKDHVIQAISSQVER